MVVGGEGGEGKGAIDTQLRMVVGGEGGEEGSIDTQLRKVVGGEGGQLMLHLERICEDIARITSDNVDLGGGVYRWQIGKDLQRHCKDYLLQC